ncbi:MAG: hypothetical protein B0W54_19065 [Cellvibrio sp. 79]|nr:MAG: hypothetical protein B0W54_19065 [Cellvibrio sp. 79]
MSLHAVKAKLPLWGGALLLPILAVGFYLDNQRHVPAIQPHPIMNPVSTSQPVIQTTRIRDQLPPAMTQKSSPETAPVVGLEPEAARQAVFRKENNVYEKAANLFEAELIDTEWASAYEASLRDMFASHNGLTRVSVNTISCRTSMCRIEVFTPRDTDADYFTAMFYNALDNFRDGTLKEEASIARRMEVGMTSVYIARKGHTLAFY